MIEEMIKKRESDVFTHTETHKYSLALPVALKYRNSIINNLKMIVFEKEIDLRK